jgi:hypothetical protein
MSYFIDIFSWYFNSHVQVQSVTATLTCLVLLLLYYESKGAAILCDCHNMWRDVIIFLRVF